MSKKPEPQINRLQQRMMVFSTAFQDLVEETMKIQQKSEQLEISLEEAKQEIAKLKIELTHQASQSVKKPK